MDDVRCTRMVHPIEDWVRKIVRVGVGGCVRARRELGCVPMWTICSYRCRRRRERERERERETDRERERESEGGWIGAGKGGMEKLNLIASARMLWFQPASAFLHGLFTLWWLGHVSNPLPSFRLGKSDRVKRYGPVRTTILWSLDQQLEPGLRFSPTHSFRRNTNCS